MHLVLPLVIEKNRPVRRRGAPHPGAGV